MDKVLLGKHFQIFETFVVSMMVMQDTDLFALKRGLTESIYEQNDGELKPLRQAIALKKTTLQDPVVMDEETQFIYDHLMQGDSGEWLDTNNDYVRLLLLRIKQARQQANEELQKQFTLLVINACSIFEIFIGDLLRFELSHVYQKQAYVAKRTLTFEQLLAAGSIDNMHAELVESLIRDRQYASVTAWLETYLEICTQTKVRHFKQIPVLQSYQEKIAQIFELRNIYVHNNGVATKKMVRLDSEAMVGEAVIISEDKVLWVIDTIFNLGIDLYLLNVKKDKQCQAAIYRDKLNRLLINYLRVQPQSVRQIYDYLVICAIKAGDYDECLIDMFNIWLSYYFANVIFEIEDYQEMIDVIDRNFPTDDAKFCLWQALISQSESQIVVGAINFLSAFRSDAERLNNINLPVFDIIKTNPVFSNYIRKLKYGVNE
ncbi:hypothetical protein MUDAN_BIHEEGNE_01670 [Lactiplantibacillus mudanjiangensis]|uniref:hypothetical protein n=1 Tax=Lactiplantibacillus mudanjiangensis TaxID=1296538 RepID=UPI001014178B|nr:hypothetical protein [Lactiplantibacillus mudanjiangensis]VDG20044.1 hypothetical protein MUDAN_BIHEEGNE_01670 [Lactiplantibacillus mudanjiangensis]VDG33441.1 hypothetical protein MUDAN_DOGOELCO_02608 [Lactiplantibacillus mudanjiangensis]